MISPCVTFNDHEGSTKSYAYTREKNVEVVQADFVLPTRRDHDRVRSRHRSAPCMLHDGSWVRLRKVAEDYDPTDRDRSYTYIRERQKEGEVVTGCSIFRQIRATSTSRTTPFATPLAQVPYEQLCPGSAELEKLQRGFR